MEVGILSGDLRRIGVRQPLHPLRGVEVVLHPEPLPGGVDPHVGVRAVPVHVTVGGRDAAVAHEIGDLVRGLGVEAPEIPLHVVVAEPAAPAPLLRADEVRELHRVADEEHRGVVADEVVIALVGVELEGEAPGVAPRVGGALLSGDGREAREHVRRRARLEQRCFRVGADVLGRLERAEGAGSLRVDVPLGDALAVEVRHLVEEVDVVQDDRTVGADGEAVAITRRRCAGVRRGAQGGFGGRGGRHGLVVSGAGQVWHGSSFSGRRTRGRHCPDQTTTRTRRGQRDAPVRQNV